MSVDLSIYFEPVDVSNIIDESQINGRIAEETDFFNAGGDFPDIDGKQIAIFGVMEDRRSINNKGCSDSPDAIRKYLYNLYCGIHKYNLVDLGNIRMGHEVDDTYFAVSSVITELIRNKIVPVIIGGSQDITYANYMAYEKMEQTVNLVTVDSRLDLGGIDQPIESQSFVSKIILHQPNYLFNFSNIGYQTYFTDRNTLDLMDKLFFDTHRLGDIRANMEDVEPIMRNADLVSFDISAVRQPDAPANKNTSPNGFYGEEICRIARYAGLSDKVSSVGFYEMNPSMDVNGQTAHLTAQMIWYFLDGYYSRKKDYPIGEKVDYTKYRVSLKQDKYEIIFYKSNKSDRWWMEVPYPPEKSSKFERHHMVPCSYADYQQACKEDMPDRWWQAYQKLS